MSQRSAAVHLKISQPLLCTILKKKTDQTLKLQHLPMRKRIGREHDRGRIFKMSALKIWFNNVGEKNASINGPLMRQKAEELAKTMDSSVQLMDGLTDGKSERILYCVQAYAWCRKKCRFFSS